MHAERLATVAAALAAPARAEIVTALMAGTAHTGAELARHVGVAPSTASEHLGVLVATGLVAVEIQGRHRYFRLAGAEVATLVESMVATAPAPPRPRPPRLSAARSCYDHLAGELGVRVLDRLVELGAVEVAGEGAALTGAGRELLAGLGVDLPGAPSRAVVRTCLDWTERRHHFGGVVGAGLLATMLARGWLRRAAREPRRLEVTATGRRGLAEELGIEGA